MMSDILSDQAVEILSTSSNIGLIKVPKDVNLTPDQDFINELAWFAYSHAQVLADVLTTFQSQETGIRLIYGLDFDVIHSYINPWLRDNSYSRIIEYFFQTDQNPFTLLPGTIEELFDYFKYIERQELKIEKFNQILRDKKANKTTIRSIKNLFRENGLGDSGKSLDNNLEHISSTLLEVSERMNLSMNRLRRVINDARLIPLRDIFKQKDGPIYREDIMHSIFVQLANYRRGECKKKANLSDAKNIATIIQHSYQETESHLNDGDNYSGFYLRLLTTTNCIINLNIDQFYSDVVGDIAKTLKSIRETSRHSRAVRNCYEAVYASVIADQCNNDLHKCREIANDLLINTQQVLVNINSINGEIWSLKFSPTQNTHRLKRLMKHKVLGFITDPCYQTMKHLLVLDSYENINKQSRQNTDYWWVDDFDPLPSISKKYISKVERNDLQKVDLEYKINSPKNLLKKFGIVEEVINIGNNDIRRWIIYNEFIVPKEELFLIDYCDGTFYASWPTNLKESKIVELLNTLFLTSLNYDKLNTEKSIGEILLVFENGERLEKLCNLPLENKLSYSVYRKMLNDIEISKGTAEILPTQIRCVLKTCNVSFDIYIADNQISHGIMFSFVGHEEEMNSLILLFKNTSIWTSDWLLAEKFNSFFERKLKHILSKWTN